MPNVARGVPVQNKIRDFIGGRNGSKRSHVREYYIKTRFLAELMDHLCKKREELFIADIPVDVFGVDIMLHCNSISKEIQLKTVDKTGKTSEWTVNEFFFQDRNGNQIPNRILIVIFIDYIPNDQIALTYRVLDAAKAVTLTLPSERGKREVSKGQLSFPPLSVSDLSFHMFGV